MSAPAWPFVVSRNRELDWRPIVVPPFVIEGRAGFLLVSTSSGDGSHPLAPVVRHMEGDRLGSATLVLASRRAGAELLGDPAGGGLNDRFGRPVYIVEGLALPGRHGVDLAAVASALAAVGAITAEVFPRFWAETDETWEAVRSEPVDLPDGALTAAPAADGRSPAAGAGGGGGDGLFRHRALLYGATGAALVVAGLALRRGDRGRGR